MLCELLVKIDLCEVDFIRWVTDTKLDKKSDLGLIIRLDNLRCDTDEPKTSLTESVWKGKARRLFRRAEIEKRLEQGLTIDKVKESVRDFERSANPGGLKVLI